MVTAQTAARSIRQRLSEKQRSSTANAPSGPNAKVVQMRRALLLGGSGGTVERVDLAKAENPVDLALVRGWITEDQHRAARRYSMLWMRHARRVLGEMPGVKVSQGPATARSALVDDADGLRSAGVATPADYELANAIRRFNMGLIDQREMNKAERAHRASRIDWARLPSKDVAAIFDAALDLHNFNPVGEAGEAAAAEDRETLLRIWRRLRRGEAQELFSVAVLDGWPNWIFQRVAGNAGEACASREYQRLVRALDVVVEESRPPREPRAAVSRPSGFGRVVGGPKRIELTVYVNPNGEFLYEAERHVRRPVRGVV